MKGKKLNLIFATSNRFKVREAEAALEQYGISILHRPVKGIEIQSEDVAEVAKYAAKTIEIKTWLPVFVEDTGIFIHALSGFPGVYSSYVFMTIGNEGVLKLLEGKSDRSAHFESAIALREGKQIHIFKERAEGTISYMARGDNGFGFDPIFIPAGSKKTYAEMDLAEKTKISHRANVLRKMAAWLIERQHSVSVKH